MFQIFLDMSKKVGIFMIISQTLLHMGIAKTYEKYIRLIISFMVAAQIIFSFISFGQIERQDFFTFMKEDFQMQWENKLAEFEVELDEMKEKIEERIELDNPDFYEKSANTEAGKQDLYGESEKREQKYQESDEISGTAESGKQNLYKKSEKETGKIQIQSIKIE